jgi:hypothetical protein
VHADPAWAFIDESGDVSLQTECGASKLYSVPILGRVARMRDVLRDRTSDHLDIVEEKRFAPLRRLVECEEMAALQAHAAETSAVRA